MIGTRDKQKFEDTLDGLVVCCKTGGTKDTAAPFDPTDETVFAISSPLYNHNWEDRGV